MSEQQMATKRKRSNGTANLEKKLAALQSDLAQLQSDLRGLAGAGGEVAGERMSDMLGQAENAADQAADQIGTWTNDNFIAVRDAVRGQPLSSVLLSIGAGAIVGAFLLRR
jgi:ElaB/YqjD/DUF883 family membrane-anchored ribosome-binding protein